MRKPMPTKLLRACAAVVLSLGLPTSAMASEWIRQLGTARDDYAYAVATDADGNVYVAGSSGPRGGEDAWLAKLGPGGRVHWKREVRNSGVDRAPAVATDCEGNIYVVGWTYGPSPDGFISEFAWLAKYDASGSMLWIRQLQWQFFSYQALDVTTDRDGNVYVAGEATSDSSPHALGWVRKYDPSGNQLGEQSPGWGSPRVATDADGDLYVEAYDSYDQGRSLSKYSAGGDRAWTLGYAIESKDNPGYPYGVAADSAGSVYVTGSTLGSDAWLAKWDTAGNELWRRRLGTAKGDGAWGRGIATDRNGNVYITGGTEGSLGGRNRGASDAWLAKYGPGGKVLWKEQLGTSRSEEGAAVATDLDGNIYVAGSTEGSLGGANRGGSDAFEAKFAAR